MKLRQGDFVQFDIKLSERELEILACLIKGLSYKKIASILNISPSTVDSHIANIKLKTKVSSKEQLITFFRQDRILHKLDKIYEKLTGTVKNEGMVTTKRQGLFWKSKVFFAICCFVSASFLFLMIYRDISQKPYNISTKGSGNILNRKGITKKIDDFIHHSEKISILALVGYGGAGKTTLARRCLREFDYGFTYEINAENLVSIRESFTNLAHILAKTADDRDELKYILSIENDNEKFKYTLKFIQSRLKQFKNWLLLFDNLEDLILLKDCCPDSLEKWGKGNVVITTRNFDIQEIRYLENICCILVGELKEEEKLALFKNIIRNNKIKDDDIKKFLKRIPSFPLDVVSAAYYIKNVGVSLNNYLNLMDEMSDEFDNLNKKLMYQYNNYDKTRYGIVTSTFKNIISKNQNSRYILLFICFMDSRGISVDLLKRLFKSSSVDALMYELKSNNFIVQENNKIFIHRSIQQIGLSYMLSHMSLKEQEHFVTLITKAMTPYSAIKDIYEDKSKIIPHLVSCIKNMDKIDTKASRKAKFELLVTVGTVYMYNTSSAYKALDFFDESLEKDKKYHYISAEQRAKLLLTSAEIAIKANYNDKATSYLDESSDLLKRNVKNTEYVVNANNLLGILEMRNGNFEEAKMFFRRGVQLLPRIDDVAARYLFFGKLKKNTVFNLLACQVNKDYLEDAFNSLQEAIAALEKGLNQESDTGLHEALIKELIEIKLLSCSLNNTVMRHEKVPFIIKEINQLLFQLPEKNSYTYFYTQGVIAMEEGHSLLRMNQLELAKMKFKEARKIFQKTMVGDYMLRLLIQEAETLIRLGELEEAFLNCKKVFEMSGVDNNKTNKLFFNTAFYNVAIIRCKQGDVQDAKHHFKCFLKNMKYFCREFLSKEKYNELLNSHAFEGEDIRTYLANSLVIFTAVCMKGSNFITDYVVKNYEELKNS